jgi:cellulose synthase (UDP-forming)
VVIILAMVVSFRYFAWRITATMNPAAAWFFYLFLAAELVGFGEVALCYLTTWKQRHHHPPPARPGRSVDVFVPTYNEPPELLRDTLICAVGIRYPHTTWVLDDGNRPEVKALAESVGCRYLARPTRDHAKAGNLNFAMAHSSAEYIVTLDADHVPMPDLIDRLLGFFEDPKVAIVQANQDFYNLDSFQHATDWEQRTAWQQQELFFNVIQPGKDALHAAMYCGSPAMLRRAALEEVGGFATETVTEDMHTGLRLQRRGWEVVYYNRSVARGLAPQTWEGYTTQWNRWGTGAMQVFRLENPLLGRGLSLRQRLAYLSSFYFYWASVQKLFFLLVPAFCILTGLFPLMAEPDSYLKFFLPALVLNLLASVSLQGGWGGFVRTERYNLIKLGSMLRSLSGLVRKKASFRVTPKARASAASIQRMLPYSLLCVLLAFSFGMGLIRILRASEAHERWAYGVTTLFALFFLHLLVPVLVHALRRRESRSIYRFPLRQELPVRVREADTPNAAWRESYADAVNRTGLLVALDTAFARGARLDIEIDLPGRVVRGEASVRWTGEDRSAEVTRFSNGLQFNRIAQEDQDAIARHLYWEVAPSQGELLRMTHTTQNQTDAKPVPPPITVKA